MMAAACRPSLPKVAEIPDMEDMPPFDPATQQSISHMGLKHVKHFLDSNPDAIVLDVRPREEYDLAHLPRAISFPYDIDGKNINESLVAHPEYDTKKKYFTYGSKEDFHSIDVSWQLIKRGFQNMFSMNGGIEDWIKEGLPVMSTSVGN